MINCPSCSNIIMKAYPLGKTKIRNSIIIIKGNKVYAVCPICKAEVLLPLSPIASQLPEYSEALYIQAGELKEVKECKILSKGDEIRLKVSK